VIDWPPAKNSSGTLPEDPHTVTRLQFAPFASAVKEIPSLHCTTIASPAHGAVVHVPVVGTFMCDVVRPTHQPIMAALSCDIERGHSKE
jgi:hypothetical protein